MFLRTDASWKILVCLALPLFAGSAYAANKEKPAENPRVLISWGWTTPDTAYARRYAEWLEQRPFDGVVFTIDPRDAEWHDEAYWKGLSNGVWLADMCAGPREKGSLNWGGGGGMTAFTDTGPWNPNDKYTDKTVAKALADLQAAKFTRFRFNLVETYVMGGANDWFNNQEWAQRCRNFAVVARFAKHAGLRGVLFDDEDYSGSAWPVAVRGGKSLEEINAKARERGREFAQAMCREFPDMVFWTLHGYSSTAGLVEMGWPEYGRSAKMPFYDGILEGSSRNFVFVDGGENSYGHNTREHFQWGRRLAKEEPIRMGLTKVPYLHRKKVRCGFGIWPDYYGRIDPVNPENSYFSPGRWQRAVSLALELSDGYVWVYGESWNWWLEGPDARAPVELRSIRASRGLPLAYWNAQKAGRMSPGTDTSVRQPVSSLPQKGRNGCIDGPELPKLLKKTEKVYELPVEGWTFKLDDWGVDRDDPKTFDKPIAIGKTWAEQGFAGPDGIGWYRLEFQLPKNLAGRRLHFYFPDVDGSVWLSSRSCPRPQEMAHRYIGLEPKANRKPFVLTHPGLSSFYFEPGNPAVVVIKVQRINGPGGILAPIQVLAEK